MRRILTIVFIVLFIGVASFVTGQNLVTESENYRLALQFRQRALIALQNGEYEQSIEFSGEAERYSMLAREQAELIALQFRARGWRNRAADSLAQGRRASSAYEDIVETAGVAFDRGATQFDNEQYEPSIESFGQVVNLLASVTDDVLPRFYTVRLIPGNRDTLNKIAGYDFVYGDRRQWRKLYDVNRSKLRQPNNPHLIHPGLVLEIPAIGSEVRSGTWKE